jgi:ubiquinone biosynthesis accessory factor UbiK
MDPRNIDELARRLVDALPGGLRTLQADLEQNFRAVLQSGLARLDLVTREEFDVQSAVLRRTREKLEALEARLAALESPPATRKIDRNRAHTPCPALNSAYSLDSPRSRAVPGGRPLRRSPAESRDGIGQGAKPRPVRPRGAARVGRGLRRRRPAGLSLVGLPATAVRESRDRVRAALLTCGFEFPDGKVIVNLAPADLPKEGGRFDLPIALGVLAASGQLPRRGAESHRVHRRAVARRRSPAGGRCAVCGDRAARDGRCWWCRRPGAEAALAGRARCAWPATCWQLRRTCRAGSRLHRRRRRREPSMAGIHRGQTCPRCAASCAAGACWRWPRQAGTTCCSSARPAPARPCSRDACPACCRRCPRHGTRGRSDRLGRRPDFPAR